jgi:hypothetical protein
MFHNIRCANVGFRRRAEVRQKLYVRFVPILLQKPFWGDEQNFLGLLMRFVYGDVGVLIVLIRKRPRTSASALHRVAAVEPSKNLLSQDFWCRSIFEFCNNICQVRTRVTQQITTAFDQIASYFRATIRMPPSLRC